MIMMTLEEKIASLPPQLRDQVEDYVDFLNSRLSEQENDTGFSIEEEGEHVPIDAPSFSSPAPESSFRQKSVKGRTDSSGIILAEERPPETDPDYIDFADINSRFGHTPKTEEEHRGHGRLRRLLDWM
ncbi:hypothetical protein DSECCO2_85820 [anaerobic digester metagenome]